MLKKLNIQINSIFNYCEICQKLQTLDKDQNICTRCNNIIDRKGVKINEIQTQSQKIKIQETL